MALVACQPAQWEETHRFGLDGSGDTTIVASGLAPDDLSGDGVTLEWSDEDEVYFTFVSVEALCRVLGRECAFTVRPDGTHRIRMEVPAGAGPSEITLRPAGRILSHNVGAVRRGNRVRWNGELPVVLEVHAENRSVLAITVGTFVRAFLIATTMVVLAVGTVWLVGRRRLSR